MVKVEEGEQLMNKILNLNTMFSAVLFAASLFNLQLALRLFESRPPTREMQSLCADTFALAVTNVLVYLAALVKELFL